MFQSIGVLQGRLTPAKGRGIQFFPGEPGEWEREFDIARELGISHLEWVWDAPENPLLDPGVQARVRRTIDRTGVPVRHADLQFLTRTEFATCGPGLLYRICAALAAIDARGADVPLLEESSLLDGRRFSARTAQLARFVGIASRHGLTAALETDLPPSSYAEMLAAFPALAVVYDSGNSAYAGYAAVEEWDAYGHRVANVQLKDRPKGGATVPLGEGGADFSALFRAMRETRYAGLITLQAARGEDGREAETVNNYLEWVRNHAQSL